MGALYYGPAGGGEKVVVEEVLHSVYLLRTCSSALIGPKHLSSFYFLVKAHLRVSFKNRFFGEMFPRRMSLVWWELFVLVLMFQISPNA